MKFLVIAYEFPPSPSAQSLRWMYLSRELAALGHEVHVLTANVPTSAVCLHEPPGVCVHRSFAGPVRGLLIFLSRRSSRVRADASPLAGQMGQPSAMDAVKPATTDLNWKGRIIERFQRFVRYLVFPDIRGEWRWSARCRLDQLLVTLQPDVVVSSHEPATTLELGLTARRRGFRWVADLGDPVLAAYTPRWWRKRARRLERATCDKADAVVVTNERAGRLLIDRHQLSSGKLHVLTQGFDDRMTRPAFVAPRPERSGLDLLYTGSFYQFRQVDALLAAVICAPGVRLSIASFEVPQVVRNLAVRHPDRIRLLGFLPHEDILRRQQQADVLVNLGNADAFQVPGKFFEYLGAGRPILHVSQSLEEDEAAAILRRVRRGWVVANDRDAIAALLMTVMQTAKAGIQEMELDDGRVEEYGWSLIARRFEELSKQVVA